MLKELRKYLVLNDVPKWYLHAFDNPKQPANWERSQLGRSFGMTMPWTLKDEDPTYPFDFEPLYNFLISNGETELA